MLFKRIIPCLDVRDGRVVKGINFVGIKDVGDPVECAIEYDRQGADEIVLLDITATQEGRGTILDVVRRTAKSISVPLTVGGGIRNVDDFGQLLLAGADKVSINSAAVRHPEILSDAATNFGSQCVVLAIDGKQMEDGSYHVFINGGETDTGKDLIAWAREGVRRGAGEILLTSMDADGTKEGFDHAMLQAVCHAVNVPVVASGGCGTMDHVIKLFEETNAAAALAASVFHYGDLTVPEVKSALQRQNIPVRLTSDSLLDIDLSSYFEKEELIPTIVQDEDTQDVLMLAYMNRDSLRKTIETGYTWFYSRSRDELWNKGATSGHVQKVLRITPDCDRDTLLIHVRQTGAACHTGNWSCFFRKGELKDDE